MAIQTEQELREKVARCAYWHFGGNEEYTTDMPIPLLPIDTSNHCYALADETIVFIKKVGYVRLADDQSLPEIPSFSYDREEDRKLLHRGVINYSKLLADWRRVILEVKE